MFTELHYLTDREVSGPLVKWIEEDEMYGLAESEVLEGRSDEIMGGVAMGRLTTIAPEDRETGPYVVRDLSWEFARSLDTDDFSTGASLTSIGAS
jgi:hypothetical protein